MTFFHPAGAIFRANDLSGKSIVLLSSRLRFFFHPSFLQVLLPVIETVGVFGNVVTIFILSRKGMRSSTNAYLTALAIADLVYLLGVFWLSLRHYPAFKTDPVLASIYAYSFPYSLWLTDATSKSLPLC